MTTVAYGIAMPSCRGILTPGPFCPQAAAFFGRLAVQPGAGRKARYDTLISALVTAGVWAKLDALYVFAADDQATALTNLVQASYGATAVSSPAFTADQGFTGNGTTSYVDSGFNASTASSPKFQQNSASIGYWVRTSVSENVWQAGTVSASGSGETLLQFGTNGAGTSYAYLTANDNNGPNAAAQITGLYTATRVAASGAGAVLQYANATNFGSITSTSQAPFNGNMMFLHAQNASNFSKAQMSAGFIGGSLTSGDVTALYNALHGYMQAVAGVP